MSNPKYPDSNIFYRRMGHLHPLIVKGDGVYLYDSNGKSYIDGSGGAVVVNAGHGNQDIIQAISRQAAEAAYIHASMFTCDAIEEYAEALSDVTPIPDAKFYFLTSGSEAVEAAIKLARQIQLERGEKDRHITISRWMSYHGLSLGALAVTGKQKMRESYLPMFQDVPHIPPPYCYRCPFNLEKDTCDLECANALETEILKQGAEKISAFIAEPISGATLGAVIPPDGYWARIAEICVQYGVLLIADEILTGMGRSGKWFAVEHWELIPDIITIGKGSASGYFPLSIVGVKNEHVDLIANGSGNFNHGGTYSHHAIGAAAGLATLEFLKKDNLIHSVSQRGIYMYEALKDVLFDQIVIGDIRGTGLMWGIEFVQNNASKKAFDHRIHFAQQLADLAFEKGLVIYPGSGSVDGKTGDHIMLAPPFIITDSQIDEMISILKDSINDLLH